ncbi:hypothetical protein OAS44_01020 [Flavobacteriaceae bacterium]|nr:hypothetical protein [Flavobacteriaceae bacterium]
MSKEVKSPQNNPEEIDLVQLFKFIGRGFKMLLGFFSLLFNKAFLAFIWFVFFIQKNILVLVVSVFVGLFSGYLIEKILDPVYQSTMLLKQNYNTGKSLYNSLEYYNGLLKEMDYESLSEELALDTSYVTSIRSFEIKEFVSDNQKYLEFNNYLTGLDSVLASQIDFDLYLESTDPSIYTTQLLTISATTNDNFKLVFEAISEKMNSIPFFLREQEKDLRELGNRRLAIIEAIKESDSLQKTYKKVLENTSETESGFQTSITFEGSEDKNKTREFELYKSDIKLREELVSIERFKENKQFIVETLSSTPSKGFINNSVEIMDVKLSFKLFCAIFCVSITFFILMGLTFLKFLKKYTDEI